MDSKLKDPVINFKGYRISKIDYSDVSKIGNENNLDVKTGINFDHKMGTVIMDSIFYNNKSTHDFTDIRKCSLELKGFFKFRNDLSENEAKKFIALNGASMLYPYLRTITSMIVSMDESDVVIMPSINFLEAYKDQNKNKK